MGRIIGIIVVLVLVVAGAGYFLVPPVAARSQTVEIERPAQTVLARLAYLITTVRQWMGQDLSRLYALGSVKSGQVALTLEFHQAATALVNWASSPAQGDGVDLMVIGNQGALYHDGGTAELWDEPATLPPAPADKNLVNLITQALQTNRPVVVKKGAKP